MSRCRIFFKGMSKKLPQVKDRWTPLYYEMGHIEQNNYSIKFSNESYEEKIPVAQVSCILLGPGTTITQAAIVACSKLNTPILWVGQDSLVFYSFGVEVNSKCNTTREHALLYADPESRLRVAQRMYKERFDCDVSDKSIEVLRGMEGHRVRSLYEALAIKHSVSWSGRNASGTIIKEIPHGINKLLNVANYYLYSLCLTSILTMGYIPSLGFIHADGKIPFVYDIADLYKDKLTIPICFKVFKDSGENLEELRLCLVDEIVKSKLLRKIPTDLKKIMQC